MGRIFPTTVLETFSPPEWVAKAYSEHMLSCSQAILDIQNSILELCSNESLNNLVDEICDTVDTQYDLILDTVLSTMDKSSIPTHPDLTDPVVSTQFYRIYDTDAYPDQKVIITNSINILRNLNSSFAYDMDDNDAWNALVTFKGPGAFLSTTNQFLTLKSSLLSETLNQLSINPQAPFTLNEGFVSVSDLANKLVDNILGADNGFFSLSLKNASGGSIAAESFDSNQIFDQMKSSFASCVAWGTGFAALAKENISDAVAYFNAQISTLISDTTEKFANTVNNVRAHLTSVSGSIKDFFEIAYTELGWKAVVEDSFASVDETDVFSYTGASPLASINTNFLKNVGAALGKTVCAVGAGIFQAAKSLVEKAWKKAKPFIMTMLDMPNDIGVIDSKDESYVCSNFTAQGRNKYFWIKYSNHANAEKFRTVMELKRNKWVAINTYFGEMFFKINYTDYDPQDDTNVALVFDVRYRPRCINYREAIKRGLCYKNNMSAADHRITFDPLPSGSDSVINAWIDFINDDYRPADDEEEAYMFMGFWLANAMNLQLGAYAASELFDWARENSIPVPTFEVNDQFNVHSTFDFTPQRVNYWLGTYADEEGIVPLDVTNSDFLKQIAGVALNSGGVQFDLFPCASSTDPQLANNSNFTLDMAIAGYMACFIIQQWDKYDNPTDYLFLPYCNDTLNPAGGRYKIKTDAENANVASVIAQAIIVIAVAVMTIIIVSKVRRAIKAKKLAKWSRTVGMMDSRMWNGEKLSGREARKYARYKKKIDKISGATSGLASSGSVLKTISDSVSNLGANSTSNSTTNSDDTLNTVISVRKLLKM